MFCLPCTANRIASGSGRVLPALRKKLPLDKVGAKYRSFVMPAILAGCVILAFARPVSLWLLTALWVVFAYRLGMSRHIHEEKPDGEEAAGHSEGAREGDASVRENPEER